MTTRRRAPKPRSQGLPIGYARVSTDEQSLALQLDALKKAGCAQVFNDKAGGAGINRPGLNDALSHLRGVKGLVDLVNGLESRDVHFRSLTDGIDTKTPAGRFFFHVMASLAQMERELIVERTRAAQTRHDRQQDQGRPAAPSRRYPAKGRRREPWGVRTYSI
jgi:DNA invertase Pin-like site-specific DNA recombinase